MLQLRERIDLSPSLLEFSFRNRLLQTLFGSLPFYFVRRALYRHTPLRSIMTRETRINERIAEYPYVFWQLGRYPDVRTILDIGSAFSLLPIQLATLGYQVTGLDIVDSRDTYHPNFVQVVSDLFDHQLPLGSFDCVVSISAIEHMGFGAFGDKVISDADVKAFEIVRQLLRPGGIAIITVPVVDSSNPWFTKTTYFSSERVDLVTKHFEVLDRRLLGKNSLNAGDARNEYFTPTSRVGPYNVHLLTLRRAEEAAERLVWPD